MKDCLKLFELADLLTEMEALKTDEKYSTSLAVYNSSTGVKRVVGKLPIYMQSKWTDAALKYKREKDVLYPPFALFVDFVRKMAIRSNDPGFKFSSGECPQTTSHTSSLKKPGNKIVLAKKTGVLNTDIDPMTLKKWRLRIQIQLRTHHALYMKNPVSEKKDIIHKYGICFKCCKGKHLARDCKENIRCEECNSTSHCTAFHRARNHGGENGTHETKVVATCTQVCSESEGSTHGIGKSCAKTVLIRIYPEGRKEDALKVYAIVDEQSNRSLARSEFFYHFRENTDEIEYIVSSCAGHFTEAGRKATGFIIETLDGSSSIKCSTLIECNDIPNMRQEIPTPIVARNYRHLKDLEQFIPEYDADVKILLLIGRDIISAHHVLDQRLGHGNEPYAQRLRLGWVIIGESCLGRVHKTDTVIVNKTRMVHAGRESILNPCPYSFKIKDRIIESAIGQDLFVRTRFDDDTGMSREDNEFLKMMEVGFIKSSAGNWSAPLPFRKNRPRLPNNYPQARQRTENLTKGLQRDPIKCQHFLEFMRKIFNNHAEEAPPLQQGEERWYLPIFGIYHPKKPSKIRVVFDSSAKYKGISLNDILMTGPDLTNNLVGILIKFRQERIAVTSDVEQMFFKFEVHEEHRNLLRFVWFKDNDPTKELIEYRMRVHVFGNSPSPAVATYGLRKSACNHENNTECDDVCLYVKDNFYVDDALVSLPQEDEAVSLVKRTQDRLQHGGKIRLHKITSNSSNV